MSHTGVFSHALGLMFLKVNPMLLQWLTPPRPNPALPGNHSHPLAFTVLQPPWSPCSSLGPVVTVSWPLVPAWVSPDHSTQTAHSHLFLLLFLLYDSYPWRGSQFLRGLNLIHVGGSSLRIQIITRKLLHPPSNKAISVLHYWNGPIRWFLYSTSNSRTGMWAPLREGLRSTHPPPAPTPNSPLRKCSLMRDCLISTTVKVWGVIFVGFL